MQLSHYLHAHVTYVLYAQHQLCPELKRLPHTMADCTLQATSPLLSACMRCPARKGHDRVDARSLARKPPNTSNPICKSRHRVFAIGTAPYFSGYTLYSASRIGAAPQTNDAVAATSTTSINDRTAPGVYPQVYTRAHATPNTMRWALQTGCLLNLPPQLLQSLCGDPSRMLTAAADFCHWWKSATVHNGARVPKTISTWVHGLDNLKRRAEQHYTFCQLVDRPMPEEATPAVPLFGSLGPFPDSRHTLRRSEPLPR